MTTTVSEEAEAAVRLLMRTLAQHTRQEAILASGTSRPRGRLRSLPGDQQAVAIRRHATLVRLASIVEAFTTESLVARLEPHAPAPRTAVLESIYFKAEDAAVSTWPAMKESYSKWLDVSFGTCASWEKIQATHVARNAIAHGLGDLTSRMTRDVKRKPDASLKLLDITVHGRRIDVKESSLRAIAEAGRDFIESLDAALAEYDAKWAAEQAASTST